MFKRFVLAFCVVLLITILVGCSNSSTNEINNTTPTKKETVNFDLSQYKDHGELSEGLLWVIKETSSWDSEPYESYAYLDVDGNVVYGWFSVGKYFKNDGYVGYVRATKLQDFKNGFALIYNDSGVDKLGGYVNATVIDTSGNEIANFLIDAYKGSTGTKMDYKDFSSQGYAFFIGKEFYDGEKGMFLHCCWECKLIQLLWKTVWRFL